MHHRHSIPLFVAAIAHSACGSSLVTLDVGVAAAWQADCSVLGFDSFPGTASFAPGFVVPLESQLASQYVECVQAVFASTGGPVAVVKVGGTSQAGDAQSPPNIIGGSMLSGSNVGINYVQPIHIVLEDGAGVPAVAQKIGAWTDPTGSLIRLDVFDVDGVLLESAQAAQGFFLGIEHEGIASATFVFIQEQSASGFTLDDVSIGRGSMPADLDGNGVVDGADLGLLLGAWGPCPTSCCTADLNFSGDVDGADLGTLLGSWS